LETWHHSQLSTADAADRDEKPLSNR
jgi:hypothetical protein